MKAKKSGRWLSAVSAGLLFFIFFVPLHVHPASVSAPLAKECACVHGQRVQLAVPADATAVMPQLQSFVLVVVQGPIPSFEVRFTYSVRGPPVFLSA